VIKCSYSFLLLVKGKNREPVNGLPVLFWVRLRSQAFEICPLLPLIAAGASKTQIMILGVGAKWQAMLENPLTVACCRTHRRLALR
jgi:hypothetical protein